MKLDRTLLERALREVMTLCGENELDVRIVVVGGAAMALHYNPQRNPTRDINCVGEATLSGLSALADLHAFADRAAAGTGREVEAPTVEGADEFVTFDDTERAEIGLSVGAETFDDVVADLHFVALDFL